jgi:hypothetical protein
MSMQPESAMETNLHDCLHAFANSVNTDERLTGLLKGWEPLLAIEATDSGARFAFQISRGQMVPIDASSAETGNPVLIRSNSRTLTRVFGGELNPAQAYLQGALEVVGSDRDQIKLDAISLVLWGM